MINAACVAAYELWFKQILWELDSVREIFISGHVSTYTTRTSEKDWNSSSTSTCGFRVITVCVCVCVCV